jgi:hypothetical protein
MNLDNLMTAAVGLKALGNELEKLVPHISSIQDHTVATLTSHLDQAMIDFRHSLLADVRSVVNEAVGGLRAEVGGLRCVPAGAGRVPGRFSTGVGGR